MNLPHRAYTFETILSEGRWPGLKRIAPAAGALALCIVTVILVLCF